MVSTPPLLQTTFLSYLMSSLSTDKTPHPLPQPVHPAPAHPVDTANTPAAAPESLHSPEAQAVRTPADSAAAGADIHTDSAAALAHTDQKVVAHAAVVAGT